MPCLLIAHRGASAVAPEGTRAAIREAVRAGADAIELDVQMTRDRRLVIFHDVRLERTTNGRGRLADTLYPPLARLDAGSWLDRQFAGEGILLVSQAIRLIPPRMRINLELKRTARPRALTHHLLRVLRRTGVRPRLLLSSFHPELLVVFARRGLAVGLICRREPDHALQRAVRLGCVSWHPEQSLVTRRRIARAHRAGLRVYTWTVDDHQRARELARWGIDGLFTNDPRSLREAWR